LKFIQNVVLPVEETVTIPPGQYNVDQLITELKTQIELKLTVGTTVAITKSATLYNLTFTFAGANNQVIFFYDTSTISNIIGLTETNTASNVIIMSNPYNLRPLDFVQVHSPQLAEMHGLDGGANGYIGLLETVSLASTGFGGIAYRQNNDDELASVIYEQPRNLSRVSIILRDEQGNRLTLPSNAYITIIIKIFFD
jgi:hypothetical protein